MPPKKGIFTGAIFTLSGRFERAAEELEATIKGNGGEVASTVTKSVTHLIASPEVVATGSNAKVVAAKAKGLPIILEGYLDACVASKRLLEAGPFALWKGVKRKESKAKGRPKKIIKIEINTTDDVAIFPKSDLEGKAAVLVDGDEPCDCELIRHNPDKHIDRFYRLQLLVAPSHRMFYVVRNWGLTGGDGRTHVTKHANALEARKVFRSKFRQRAGYRWVDRASAESVDGKYRLIKRDEGADATGGLGRWEYFLHNSIDGKAVGWYQYGDGPNEEMERLWRMLAQCPEMKVRLMQTDYFLYEVDFDEMIQTNRTSGTRRVVRRVSPGALASSDPPVKIPAAVPPMKSAEAPPETEDEDEDGVADGSEDEAAEDDEADDAAHSDADTVAADLDEAAAAGGDAAAADNID